jgi:hypothetical protein
VTTLVSLAQTLVFLCVQVSCSLSVSSQLQSLLAGFSSRQRGACAGSVILGGNCKLLSLVVGVRQPLRPAL